MKKIYIDEHGRFLEGVKGEAAEIVEDNLAEAGYFEAIELERKMEDMNKLQKMKLKVNDKFAELKEGEGIKPKLNRFGRGAKASFKKAEDFRPVLVGAAKGAVIVGAVNLATGEGVKGAAVDMAKSFAKGATAGLGVQATLNGLIAIGDEGYLAYLEER